MVNQLKVMLVVLVFCAATTAGTSQAAHYSFAWKKVGLAATALAAIPDGGVVGVLNARVWCVKSNGELLWERSVGAEGRDEIQINDVIVLPDRNVMLAGIKYKYFKGRIQNGDLWVARLSAKGELLWENTFGGGMEDWATAIAGFPEGGFAVAGETQSKGAGNGDVWVLRLDSGGGLLWENTFGGKRRDSAKALAALADGGLAVAGWTLSKGAGESDIWVMRLDSSGKLLWDKAIGGDKSDSAEEIVVLPDGSLAVGGETLSQNARWVDIVLARLDANGKQLWYYPRGTEGRDKISDMIVLPDGELVVAGSTWTRGASFGYGWVMGLDINGELRWDRIFSGDERDTVNAIVALPDGDFVMSGGTYSVKEKKWSSWLIRFGLQHGARFHLHP
jgi:uncharacterized delta-60 repeat protein